MIYIYILYIYLYVYMYIYIYIYMYVKIVNLLGFILFSIEHSLKIVVKMLTIYKCGTF